MLIQGEIQETYWFLYAYIGFLIFLPLLRKFVKNIYLSDYKYLLFITFLFECINIVNVVAGITINSGIMSFTSSVCNYTFYAISGYVIEQNCEMLYSDKKYIKHATITSVALVLMPMFIISFLYYAKGEYADWAIGMFNQFLTISVFYIILYLCHIYKHNLLISSISKLGKFVFAMFLVEQFSRHILLNLYLYLISNTIGIFAAFVYWFTTFILSFILAVIMKCIPGVKRLL